jgi:hypothetical protein
MELREGELLGTGMFRWLPASYFVFFWFTYRFFVFISGVFGFPFFFFRLFHRIFIGRLHLVCMFVGVFYFNSRHGGTFLTAEKKHRTRFPLLVANMMHNVIWSSLPLYTLHVSLRVPPHFASNLSPPSRRVRSIKQCLPKPPSMPLSTIRDMKNTNTSI